jgi:hypothetical protein
MYVSNILRYLLCLRNYSQVYLPIGISPSPFLLRHINSGNIHPIRIPPCLCIYHILRPSRPITLSLIPDNSYATELVHRSPTLDIHPRPI